MDKHGTVPSFITGGQIRELISALAESIPLTMESEVAQQWIMDKSLIRMAFDRIFSNYEHMGYTATESAGDCTVYLYQGLVVGLLKRGHIWTLGQLVMSSLYFNPQDQSGLFGIITELKRPSSVIDGRVIKVRFAPSLTEKFVDEEDLVHLHTKINMGLCV